MKPGTQRIVLTAGAFAVLGVSYGLNWHWETLWSLVALSALAAWTYRSSRGMALFLLTVISLPLSIKWALPYGDLHLPSEWLIAALALVVAAHLCSAEGWQLLKKYPLPALWIASFIPAVALSEMPGTSLKFWVLNGLLVTVFYYGCIWWGSRGKPIPIVPFLWAMIPVLCLGAVQFYKYDFNPVTITGIYRPFFYSHTMLGATLAVLAGYSVGRASTQSSWRWPAAVLVGLASISGSRAAFWSVAFMLVLWLLVRLPAWLRIALPLVTVAGGLALFGTSKIEQAFAYNSYESHDPQASLAEKSLSVTNVQTDASNIERLNRWVSALRMFKARPWVGFGPGTYQFTYIPFQEERLENRLTVRNPDSPPEGSGGSAHSELLLQLSENGVGSTLIFLLMLGRWIFFGFFRSGLRDPLLPLFLGLSTYLLHMQFNNFLNQPVFAFLFWSFAAYFDLQLTQRRHELLP